MKPDISFRPNFIENLALMFIGLKLGGIIHWSWLWVLSPFWIPAIAVGIVYWVLRRK